MDVHTALKKAVPLLQLACVNPSATLMAIWQETYVSMTYENGVDCRREQERSAKTLQDLGLAGQSPDTKTRFMGVKVSKMLHDFDEYFLR